MRQKVLSGLGWLVAGRGVVQTIRWVATIYVIRLLAPEDYGIVAVATVFFGLLISLCDAGFGNAVVVNKDVDDRTLGEFQGFLLLVSVVLGLSHLAGATFLARFFDEPRIVPVIKVLSLGFLFTAISIIPSALLNKRMEFKRFAACSAIATLTGTTVTVILAHQGYAFWSLIIGQLVIELTFGIACMFAAGCWLLPRLPGKSTLPLIRVGTSITASSALWYLYTKLDVFIAGRLWNSTILGYYTVPVHLARLPAGKVMPLLRRVAMPSFAQLRDDPEAIAYYFRRAFAIGALVAFPVFFGIASVSQTAVPLILGQKWTPSTWLLFTVCLGMPFSSLIALFGPVLQATGHHALALSNTTYSLFLFAITFTLGALSGPLGLAAAWAISFPILFGIIARRSAPRINVDIASLLKAIASPMIAATFMLGANMIFYHLADWSRPSAAMLAAQIIVGCITYVAAIYVIDRQMLMSAVSLVRRNRPATA